MKNLKAIQLGFALVFALATSASLAGTSLVSTIDTEGKAPELAPAKSEYFESIDAGLVREGRNIGYFWLIKPTKPIEMPLYVRVSYTNPCGTPLVNDATISPKQQEIGLSSPNYVLGLEKGKIYSFKLEVFHTKGDASPIGVMEQNVASVFTNDSCTS